LASVVYMISLKRKEQKSGILFVLSRVAMLESGYNTVLYRKCEGFKTHLRHSFDAAIRHLHL